MLNRIVTPQPAREIQSSYTLCGPRIKPSQTKPKKRNQTRNGNKSKKRNKSKGTKKQEHIRETEEGDLHTAVSGSRWNLVSSLLGSKQEHQLTGNCCVANPS